MITCCLFGGGLSDYTHLNCGHQVCSVCSARSLTDQRKVGLPLVGVLFMASVKSFGTPPLALESRRSRPIGEEDRSNS